MNDMPGSLGRRPGWKDGLESGVKPPHSKRWRAVQRPVRKPDDWAGEFPVLPIRSETRNLGLSLGSRRFQKSVPCNSTYLQNEIKLRVEDNFRSRRRYCAIQGPKGADPGSSGILHDNSFTTPLPGPNKLRRLFAQAVSMKTMLIFVSLAAVAAVLCAGTVSPSPSLVAHEWGTFTSLQGANGALIPWKPLTTSQLPGFVYDWQRPGLNRLRTGQIFKGEMITLQRMETPVIYFYSDRKASVDVDVRFPHGTITEWYPQAPRVGPSMIPGPQTVTKFESILQRCGLSSLLRLDSFVRSRDVTNSEIEWSHVQVIPPSAKAAQSPRMEGSGSHYYAARATDSDLLSVDSHSGSEPGPEYEKFLFYRGAGSFATPLQVKLDDRDNVTLINTGTNSLRHLFILKIGKGAGHFTRVDQLQPGQSQTIPTDSGTTDAATAKLGDQWGTQMAEGLVAEGLYPAEARAMVNTWRDSWFAEDGMRVLYVLPRAWTDTTLPMRIKPAPHELVRVMVGRAEVLTPETENELAALGARAVRGDAEALNDFRSSLRRLGRFAEPALRRCLAIMAASEEWKMKLWAQLRSPESSPPPPPPPPPENSANERCS